MSIQALTLAKVSARSIVEKLDLHVSSIYRELNRGKADETSLSSGYRAVRAHDRARAKRRWAGVDRRKLGFDLETPLWRTVIDGLRSRWSLNARGISLQTVLPRISATTAGIPASIAIWAPPAVNTPSLSASDHCMARSVGSRWRASMNNMAPTQSASMAQTQPARCTQNSGRRSSRLSRTVPPPKAASPGDHADAHGVKALACALDHAGQGKRDCRDHLNGDLGVPDKAQGTVFAMSFHAGQARILKASTRNSTISRTFGETILREV